MRNSYFLRTLFYMLAAVPSYTLSEALVLYVFNDGNPAANSAISLNGGPTKPIDTMGSIAMSVTSGTNTVELFDKNQNKALMNFEFDKADNENVDISVVINNTEEPQVLIESYIPGEEIEDKRVNGTIVGEVVDAETNNLISNAKIALNGTNHSTFSDEDGYFEVKAPRGVYNLSISHPDYGQREIDNFRIVSFVNKQVNFSLAKDRGDIEEVEVLAKYKANEFVDKERFAINVVDVLDAEAMARFGDSSAGDALKRVAGVSMVGSKYAVIRGLQGRFISSTLNNGSMPSLNPTRRDIALDIFPSSILGGLEIEKSYRPELPGNTTGGLINIVTKQPAEENINQLSLGLGMTTGVTNKNQITYQGSKMDILGFDGGMRSLPTRIDNATDFGTPGTTSEIRGLGKDFKNIYDIDQKKAGPDIDLAYAYGDYYELDSGNLSFYSSIAYSNESSARQDAIINDSIGAGNFTYERSTFSTDLSGYLAAGYEDAEGNNRIMSKTLYLHQSSDTTRVDKGINAEEVGVQKYILQWIENSYLSQQFSGTHSFDDQAQTIDWFITLGQTHRYEPDRRSFEYRGGAPLITSLERRFGDMTENNIDLGINYIYDFSLSDWADMKLKSGVYTQLKDRDAKIARFKFSGHAINTLNKTMEESLSAENFEAGLVKAEVGTSVSDNYKASDTLAAFYLSSETTFFEQWDLLAGIRFESSSQEIEYPNNPSIDSTFDSSDMLPVLSLTYRLDDHWQFRGSVSQTVSRPGMTERAKSKFYDPETDDLFFGNPDLEKSTIMNLDLRTEYYYNDNNTVSLAVFSKAIEDPIEIVKFSCSGSACDGYSFKNQKSASLLGVEIDFNSVFYDSDSWSSFVKGNLSYIDSKLTLDKISSNNEFGNPTSRKLQGQSDVLANIQLGIDHFDTHQQFSLAANYFSDRIFRVENTQPNKIEKGRIKLDAVYQWSATDTLDFKAKIKNILNSKTEYAREGRDVIESYKNGVGFSFSTQIKF